MAYNSLESNLGSCLMSLQKLSLTLIAALWLVGCDKPVFSNTNTDATQATAQRNYSLTDYHWRLQSVLDENKHALPQIPSELLNSNKGITLQFSDDRILVEGLCNHISNAYELKDGQLTVGHGISTMKACPESALMMAEQYLAGQLPKLKQYQFDSSPARLLLNFDDASQWQLQGELSLQAQYGAPTTIFYEVRAEKPSCPNSNPPITDCLTVREVFYNEQGLKTREGDWHLFAETIEGYQHRDDTHTILRLHRYTVPAQSGETTMYRYVLDMPIMVSSAPAE